jgi:hypothetical protein
VPNPALWSVGGPNCFDGSGKATIDAAVSHGGKQSVRIDPGSSYCGHAFIINTKVASMGSVVYGRFYIRLATALGDPHVTFMSMHDAIESVDGSMQDLRMGGQSGILMWNRSKDDATLPSLSPTGISLSAKMPAATWTCIEFGLNSAMGTMQTWVNGTAVAALQLDSTQTADIDQAWLASRPSWKPQVTDLKLGWEAYGGNGNTVWLDDVALHTSRIGCGS